MNTLRPAARPVPGYPRWRRIRDNTDWAVSSTSFRSFTSLCTASMSGRRLRQGDREPSSALRRLDETLQDRLSLANRVQSAHVILVRGGDFRIPVRTKMPLSDAPLLRVGPAQVPRLQDIHANLGDLLQETREPGWLGEVAAIETTMAAADQKLKTIRDLATRTATIHLGPAGHPRRRPTTGR